MDTSQCPGSESRSAMRSASFLRSKRPEQNFQEELPHTPRRLPKPPTAKDMTTPISHTLPLRKKRHAHAARRPKSGGYIEVNPEDRDINSTFLNTTQIESPSKRSINKSQEASHVRRQQAGISRSQSAPLNHSLLTVPPPAANHYGIYGDADDQNETDNALSQNGGQFSPSQEKINAMLAKSLNEKLDEKSSESNKFRAKKESAVKDPVRRSTVAVMSTDVENELSKTCDEQALALTNEDDKEDPLDDTLSTTTELNLSHRFMSFGRNYRRKKDRHDRLSVSMLEGDSSKEKWRMPNIKAIKNMFRKR